MVIRNQEGIDDLAEYVNLVSHVLDVGTAWRFDLAQDAEVIAIEEGPRGIGRRFYGCLESHALPYTSKAASS
jgi:hypothetical protein